ncbi:hypothetical protein [Calothrix sp. NIES-2098]|uniref:hypothetical protein n=1 Tax=Calothrix sp. NIES-2098 TaxID=1954171 RepID=UPI0030DA8B2B
MTTSTVGLMVMQNSTSIVIASVAQRNEAIPTSCDCFVVPPLFETLRERNDT